MSLGGDIMEEHYDKLIQEFLEKLKSIKVESYTEYLVWNDIVEKYKEHFKNNGIYS